ncbi:MAG: hypothetical protein IPK07_01005 [Deltaproteobacteria bacterium]|nr:hypothetical protein [Deltaproteobacteria bacterium]
MAIERADFLANVAGTPLGNPAFVGDVHGGALLNAQGGTMLVAQTSLIQNFVGVTGALSYARSGGGIANWGDLLVRESLVAHGGIGGASVQVCSYPGAGGGIYNSGTLGLLNATVTGNTVGCILSGIEPNGVHTEGPAALQHVTLVDDDLVTTGVPVELANTLFDGASCIGGNFVSGGGNLEAGADTCGLDGPSDQPTAAEPRLGPLDENGGPTQTFPLLVGSPARDAGFAAACSTIDQRGANRDDGRCDIGSFEHRPGDP